MLPLDTTATVEVVLATDRSKPESERPTFLARHPTAREMLRIQAAMDKATADPDPAACIRHVVEALGIVLAGGRNLPAAFAPELLPDWLTVGELYELLTEALNAVRFDEDARKKSASPSRFAGAQSAPGAAANA